MDGRVLVVIDSVSGVSRRVAARIARAAEVDVEQLVDRRSGQGLSEWLRSHLGSFEHVAELAPLERDATQYDLVIVGTPIRGASVSAAVRSYLSANSKRIDHVAFFCTHDDGDRGSVSALREMAALCGKTPAVSLVLRDSEVMRGGFDVKIWSFLVAACRAGNLPLPASGSLPPMARTA